MYLQPRQSLFQSEFVRQLSHLLLADIVLSFAYGFVPTSFSFIRSTIALIQLGFMAVTMFIAVRRVLQDY